VKEKVVVAEGTQTGGYGTTEVVPFQSSTLAAIAMPTPGHGTVEAGPVKDRVFVAEGTQTGGYGTTEVVPFQSDADSSQAGSGGITRSQAGWLLMEIGHGQRAALAQLLNGWNEVGFVQDLQRIPRVAV